MDMGLDANQAKTYHDHSFDTNGSYRLWANEYRNATNDTYLQSVSSAYFYVSCVTWILPPFLYGILMASGFAGFAQVDEDEPVAKCISFCTRTKIKAPCGCCFRALLFFVSLPIYVLMAVLGCYIIIPMAAIVGGIRKLLNEDFDEDQDMFGVQGIRYKSLPGLKLFECFGEFDSSTNSWSRIRIKQLSLFERAR